MVDEGFNKYYKLVKQVEEELHSKKEITFARIAEITGPQDVRASAIIDELVMSGGIKVDYKAGKLIVN